MITLLPKNASQSRRVEVVDEAARLALTAPTTKLIDIIAEVGRIEITRVVPVADVNGSLNGCYWLQHDGVDTVEIYLRTDGVKQVTTIDLTGAVAASLEGDSFDFYWDPTNPINFNAYAFTLLAGSSPGVVGIDAMDTDADIATKLETRMSADGSGAYTVSRVGAVVTVTLTAVGDNVPAPVDHATGFSFTVTVNGEDPATAPGVGARAIQVVIANNATALVIASAIAAAVDADDLFDATEDGEVLISNVAKGSHAASDGIDAGATNFGFTREQAGIDAGGTFQVVNPDRLGNNDAFAVLTLDS